MTAKCCLVTIFPLLIAAVWLASATATSTGREPKQLLFPTPFYRIQPVMESRFGPGLRQSNSPIYPMIGQQGFGPFLGDFPNQLFRQSCPDCATPPAETITTCGWGKDARLSAAPSGTISVTIPQIDKSQPTTLSCLYGFVAYYPNSKVQLKCTSLGSGTTLGVYNIVYPVTEGAVDTVYTSKGSFLLVALKGMKAESELQAECTWETVLG
ncbi:uncharacterized protein LOC124350002 isoform X2 [Daphnia pulicaria]|uniref:uncharacterized protein LOC124350002 isoform X2 n=1 Tax=Daphnia pulicaria TaxID=35523 RepID=UPI001EEA7AD7|nr:uncharacterized protein LOC124350002 isoform X2 [Daphnia pulicaria]